MDRSLPHARVRLGRSVAAAVLGSALGWVLLGAPGISLAPRALADDTAGKITHTVNGNTETWRIDEPNVKQQFLEFPTITFAPGDKVTVTGGGCVQTGGTGQTWKRYVDPLGPNTDKLYHGMVLIPGAIGQLPATSLANFARILIIKGHQYTVGAIDEPRKAHLWLGYEDDNYGDNGYWGQDAGTQGQCRIGNGWVEHAFVFVSVVHGGAPPPPKNFKPFDLSVNSINPANRAVDDNLILFNPVWAAQLAPQHPLPSAATCDPSNRPSDPKDCTTQVTAWDGSDVCTVRGWFTGDAGGHRNWAAGTYQGRLYWEAHSAPGTDDDYNFRLVPPDRAGLTTDSGKTDATGEPSLGLEFDSDETIDHFTTPWWSALHAAVDADDKAYADYKEAIRLSQQNPPIPIDVAKFKAAYDHQHAALTAITDGRTVIAVGLVGLDGAHGYYTELHPVWAIAIQTNDDPNDEVWAIFAMRWGGEGFCSGDQHYLDDLQGNQLVFRLPWRAGATGVQAAAGTMFLSRLGQASGPGVSPVSGQGVLVSFGLPAPDVGHYERVNGELHLHWTGVFKPGRVQLGGRLVARSASGGAGAAANQETQEGEPEARVAAALAELTPAQKATFTAQLPAKTAGMDTHAPQPLAAASVTARPILGGGAIRRLGPTTRAVPDPDKQAKDRQRLAAFRAVSNEAIPLEEIRKVVRPPVGVVQPRQ